MFVRAVQVLLIGTLAGCAGSAPSSTAVENADDSKVASTKFTIGTMKAVLGDYKKYCSRFPTTEQGLDALLRKPNTGPKCKHYPASTFYTEKELPFDAWSRPFLYSSDGKTFTIVSLGRDGNEGGEGYDKDIIDSNQ